MIDLTEAEAISLGEVPRHVPPGRGGRRVNASTVARWCLRGVRGVRLESVVVGGRRYTDRAAIARFIAATTAAGERRLNLPNVSQASTEPPNDRSRSIAIAQEGLTRVGV